VGKALDKELKPIIKQLNNNFDNDISEIPGDDGELCVYITISFVISKELYNEMLKMTVKN
jgi:hypothetical protein